MAMCGVGTVSAEEAVIAKTARKKVRPRLSAQLGRMGEPVVGIIAFAGASDRLLRNIFWHRRQALHRSDDRQFPPPR